MTFATPGESAANDDEYPTIFREYLYADLERARSLLAQRLGGVPEEDRTTDGTIRHLAIGARNYLGVGRESRAEVYEQRSLLDAIFPVLEEVLEVEQWLTDISEMVHDANSSDPSLLRSVVQPGSLVRLTGEWQLFDASYIAHTLAGTAAAADGIASLETSASTPAAASASGGRGGNRKGQQVRPPRRVESIAHLEDMIEEFPPSIMGGMEAKQLRAMVKVSRGMFAESGLHVLHTSSGGVGWTITSRLQRGRQYLDTEPDILFSRYGTTPLEWTVVGTVGHFSQNVDPKARRTLNFMNPNGTVSRSKFVEGLNWLMSSAANLGFADVPPFPGFSIIPLAVYRLIPKGARM